MHFTKYHGLGNDFVFLDGAVALSVNDPAALAVRLCNRRTGIGADGLVLLLPSQKADVRMRIFNSDGSEAEMCGNASRCVPMHLLRSGQTHKKQIVLETLAGPIETEIIDEKNNLVRVNMGRPRDTQLPFSVSLDGQTWTGTCVSMGNPHFVVQVEDVEQFPVDKIGPQLEVHSAFPHKTNVEFVQILNEHTVRMRVWERGAGITQACGTGACATAAACVLNKLTGPQVTVKLDGGDLQIAWPDQQEIWMTGPATYVFEGDVK
ncbi:MAG: diaminopimelate epimerase [Elusimicrobiaceae bacterium]|nr:diaminopimelate epimerase [Elusimicrobiaceae bacterium]